MMPTWTTHPHDPLKQLEPNLWDVNAQIPRTPLNRRMAIVRLKDGSLLVHNANCVDGPTLKQIEALGEPRWLVVPNGYHRMDCAAQALQGFAVNWL